MATFADAYEAWRRQPIPRGAADDAVDELHAALVLADSWVAESVIPLVERARFVPAELDVLGELTKMRDRAVALRDPARVTEYLTYIELLTDVYGAFLRERPSTLTRTIHVGLLDEGIDVWRPVEATEQASGTFRLPDKAPDGEAWRFPPGSVVRCELRKLADGDTLVAIELVG
jgi:hypothetical protein